MPAGRVLTIHSPTMVVIPDSLCGRWNSSASVELGAQEADLRGAAALQKRHLEVEPATPLPKPREANGDPLHGGVLRCAPEKLQLGLAHGTAASLPVRGDGSLCHIDEAAYLPVIVLTKNVRILVQEAHGINIVARRISPGKGATQSHIFEDQVRISILVRSLHTAIVVHDIEGPILAPLEWLGIIITSNKQITLPVCADPILRVESTL
mmetsp:Transcript_50323/g.143885  ORF Transcript_50323/g.143885 Transcript_50323/m.143885 type:complete len:209 (-) Transcript_50323:993-1619(-)